jgi:hypothetical protein
MIMLLAGWSLAGCSWLLLLAGWLLAGWPCMHVAAASTPLGKKTDALIVPDCPRPARQLARGGPACPAPPACPPPAATGRRHAACMHSLTTSTSLAYC